MNDVDRYVAIYGERFRRLITEALKFIEGREWAQDEAFDRDEYMAAVMERAS